MNPAINKDKTPAFPQNDNARPFHVMMTTAAHLLEMKSLTLLGSTGSIGVNTLDVVRRNPHHYGIHALAAGHNVAAILQQIIEFRPDVAVLAAAEGVGRLAAATNGRKPRQRPQNSVITRDYRGPRMIISGHCNSEERLCDVQVAVTS